MRDYDASQIPDLLTTDEHIRIDTATQWEAVQRPQILRFFRDEVFGRMPERPADLTFRRVLRDPDALDGSAVLETIEIAFFGPYGRFTFPFSMFLPKQAQPCGATLLICNRDRDENMDLSRTRKTGFWPVEEIVARGYAACAFFVGDVDTDEDDGSVHGVQQAFTPERGPHDWGTLAAWAWGAMRVMDYLETDARIDAKRVAVIGQSRGGKTALYCGAMDERFAAVFASCSGCTGAALSRFATGETIRQINEVFPYWFCGAYKQYNDRAFDMRWDQHALLASIAPRLLYVTSATEDVWADLDAELMATKLAGAAYRLYGQDAIPMDAAVTTDIPIHAGAVGYHRRKGAHDLQASDWMHFLDFLGAPR